MTPPTSPTRDARTVAAEPEWFACEQRLFAAVTTEHCASAPNCGCAAAPVSEAAPTPEPPHPALAHPALTVACPSCGAEAGELCQNADDMDLYEPHRRRVPTTPLAPAGEPRIVEMSPETRAMWEEREGWKRTASDRGFEVAALRARVASLTTERDGLLRELAAVFPGSKWADRIRATSPESPV